MSKKLFIPVLTVVAASQMGATNCGQITRDPGFDLWCGDSLCAWKVERGTVARVPTWNEGDPGVQLLGSDTAIEQLTGVTSNDTDCIEFDLLTNIDLDSQVTLDVDIDGDGSIEKSFQIPAASWKPVALLVRVAGPYAGVRFEITKAGGGSAVLANIGAQTSSACDPSLPAIVPGKAPLGAPCNTGTDCTSGLCDGSAFLPGNGVGQDGFCTSCEPGGCGSGQQCGAGVAVSPVDAVPLACSAIGSKKLGELCVTATECASGQCYGGACSTCGDPGGGCPGTETCAPGWPVAQGGFPFFIPYECDPGKHAGSAGAPCAENADCASNQCNGTTASTCSDGRPCTSAQDCPIDNALLNGDCAVMGVVGGTCG
jgi:hypothetical protein